ncbi:uncharacterized protein WM294_013300 [Sarcoramphus papa]
MLFRCTQMLCIPGVPRHLASSTQNRGVFFKAADLHSKVLRWCRYLIADPAEGSTGVPALGCCSRCWISRSKLVIMKKKVRWKTFLLKLLSYGFSTTNCTAQLI